MKKIKTLEKVIEDFNNVHNFRYHYYLVDYINAKTKVTIICKEHGPFDQIPSSHLKGRGCPNCSNTMKLSTDKFTKKSNNIYNYFYDYSLVDYINNKTKVIIICKEHGPFEQTPNDHLSGHGCPSCGNNKKYTIDEILFKFNEKHNYFYDYSLVEYINIETKVRIICKEHGPFEQTPYNHISGCKCPYCSNNIKKTTENYIKECKIIHNNKYKYPNTNYINSHTKVEILCPDHGNFYQKAYSHSQGIGCPDCNESKGEKEIRIILEKNNINFGSQKMFDDCKNINKLKFDFYLPDYNTCIEYDGIQHFIPINYFGGEKTLIGQQLRDNIKTEYCKENEIKLIRIRYDENINDELINIINKKDNQ